MKIQREKKGKQAFRYEKIFRIALAVLGKQNVSSTIPHCFVPNFCMFFKHFKKAIVNVD